MEWKKVLILKANLPPKLNEGDPMTNEYRQSMDAWATDYTNRLVAALRQMDSSMDSSWCKIDPVSQKVTWRTNAGSRDFSFDQFANELKACLRAVVHGYHVSNYAYDQDMYLQQPAKYLRDMVRNSTASTVFERYLQK